ncbi:MAG: metallophosphoesterase [Pseudomonadota bacterium]
MTSSTGSFRIGVVGDLHSHFDEIDVHQLNEQHYDLIFFTGDLGGGAQGSSLHMARIMSDLDGPVLVMPGNNDTIDITELGAELMHRHGLHMIRAIATHHEEPGAIALCGYSHHPIAIGGRHVSLIAARPHSMGGPSLTFADHLAHTYSIHSLVESVSRLKSLIDEANEEIIFLAHNGPYGLGSEPGDIWGCDFKAGAGDWGDTDLTEAIDYALSLDKRVLAVVAGHMHLMTKQKVERPWRVESNGIDYINAARVPRIFNREDGVYRHHVCMTLTQDQLEIEEILLVQ